MTRPFLSECKQNDRMNCIEIKPQRYYCEENVKKEGILDVHDS